MWFDQSDYDVRCEWGERAVEILSPIVDVVVLVDVLSFTTCVDVATARGALVYPYRWKDATAAEFADRVGATLAGPRSGEHLSLSPASLQRATPGMRVVLPSPNGATLSGLTGRAPTLAGCLRNAEAVARAAQAIGPRIAVIPAGERWPDGTLRPCLEDWLGAGAIIRHLFGSMSPETKTAREVYDLNERHLTERIHSCTSGRELIEQGWEEDVRLASQVGTSNAVPMLIDGAYQWPGWATHDM